MRSEEIIAHLRNRHVDGVFEWGDDYDGFWTALQSRLGCLSVKLTQLQSTTVQRWHAFTLDRAGKLAHRSYDLLDDKWLESREQEADLALKVVEAAESCGWQVVGPDLTEQPAPSDWKWPLPSWDYQSGEYTLRDYIIRGMRDY